MNTLSNYVKLTSSITSNDNLINIINYINQIDINIDNLNLILKIISNIVFNHSIKIQIDIEMLIDKFNDMLDDGHVICLIKIYSTPVYSNPIYAINLLNKYNVHKTSSYLPIFNHLIAINSDQLIIELYMQLIEQNNRIIESNRQIKIYNYKARLYNQNISILKNKYLEIESIINIIKDINIESNPFVCKNIDIKLPFGELKYKTEQNLIQLDNQLEYILTTAIKLSNKNIIDHVIKNYIINDKNLLLILKAFEHHTITTLNIQNTCDCCGQKLYNNILTNEEHTQILKLLTDKILKTNHRTDNGIIIEKKELLNIKNKYDELQLLLNTIDFNIIIDGGNLGLSNQSDNEINIGFMRKIINKLLTNDKPILLIIHQRHHKKIKQLNINNCLLKILFTPHKLDDDLFWLYAAINAKAFILTKDQARDNSCMISYQTEIKKFLKYYQINTDNLIDISKYKINENSLIMIDDKIHIKLDTNRLVCI